MLPFDDASLGMIGVASSCLLAAALMRTRPTLRLALVVIAALVIRIDPARQWALHPWDERIHALVAKHFVDHPLTPTLYEHPVTTLDARVWTENHVWLHKPPLSMWLMALSLWSLGLSALAMRLPSILLSASGVVLAFVTGRRLFSERVGLLAAGFQAVNGLLVGLASGRRVCDHVDTALIACVQIGVSVVLVWPARPGLETRPPSAGTRPPYVAAILAGLAMGAGLLAKSAPALLIAVVAAAMWIDWRSPGGGVKRLAVLTFTAALVAAPWMISAQLRFPVEAAAGNDIVIKHMSMVLDGAGGPWWTYLADMPHFFGELVYVPVVWFLVRACRSSAPRSERALLVWLVTPYLVFSIMPTKLPGFVAIGAPALFLIQAAFWCQLKDASSRTAPAWRVATVALLVLLAVLPARLLLEPQGPFERRDRFPASSRQLMTLESELGTTDAVIFNMPRAHEAMFYSRYTAYTRMPQPAEIEELRRRSIPIVIFVPAGSGSVDVPSDWHARFLAEAVR